jgi:hypothetical protein
MTHRVTPTTTTDTADSLEEWAERVADDVLDVLADADRAGRPDEIVGKLAELHAAAVDVRDTVRAATER